MRKGGGGGGGGGGERGVEEEGLELYLWGGGWGIPSIDPESLQALAQVRFAGAPTIVKECNNPWKSPKWIIPFFKTNSVHVYSANEIGIYLRSKNMSGDYHLSSLQCAETVAYRQLIWDGLHVAYEYFFWLHELNYADIVRPFYGYRLPWLYKLWYPERLKGQAKNILISIYKDAEDSLPQIESFVLEKARKCVTLLSQKLGENEFFMGGNSPTTIDAVVFSYLVVFWKVKLPHNPLKEVICSYPNLERFLGNVLRKYFPLPPDKIPRAGQTYGENGELINKETMEGAFTPKQKIAAGFVASALMLLYAVKNGIVRIPSNVPAIQNPPEDDEEYWEES